MARIGCIILVRFICYPKISYKLLINTRFRYTPWNYNITNKTKTIEMLYLYKDITISIEYNKRNFTNVNVTYINTTDKNYIHLYLSSATLRFIYEKDYAEIGVNYHLYINILIPSNKQCSIELFDPIRNFKEADVFTLFSKILHITLQFNNERMLRAIKDGFAIKNIDYCNC